LLKLLQGLKWEQGAEPPSPLTLTTGLVQIEALNGASPAAEHEIANIANIQLAAPCLAYSASAAAVGTLIPTGIQLS